MESIKPQEFWTESRFPRLGINSTFSTKQKNYFDVLPHEILLKILHYVKADEIFQFYNTVTKVCTTWKTIATDYRLWQVVDVPECGKLGKEQFMKWQKSGVLRKTKKLNLVHLSELLSTEELKTVCSSCPELKCLAIGKSKLLKNDFFQSLYEDCPNLSHLTFSGAKFKPKCLENLLMKCGHNIFQLGISEIYVRKSLTSSLTMYCPNIQELDMSNLSDPGIFFPVEEFQRKCPFIRILHLTNTSFLVHRKTVDSPGFLDLEEISLAVVPGKDSVSDDCFWRILNKSSKLKLLDIRGCTKLSVKTIILLPANDLESIFMSHTKLHLMGSPELIMAKYKHSLREVDLSWNSCTITSMIDNLICSEHLPLETLDLSGSKITMAVVKVIIDNFKHLKSLNLQSCRSIERHWRKQYRKNELQELCLEIEKSVEIVIE